MITYACPTYNPVKEWMQQAISSSAGVDEIIIGDDHSDQHVLTKDYIFPPGADVRVIRHDHNLGIFKNLNAIIPLAAGDWITTQADDDFFDKMEIPKILAMVRKSTADVITFPCMYCGLMGGSYGVCPNPKFSEIYRANNIYGASFFRKFMWEFLEGFQLDVAGDWDFWLRALKSGFKFEHYEPISAYFRVSDRSSFERSLAKMGRNNIHKMVHRNVDKWKKIYKGA